MDLDPVYIIFCVGLGMIARWRNNYVMEVALSKNFLLWENTLLEKS